MNQFKYWKCPDCEFDAVLAAFRPNPFCPMCAGDCGHDVPMICARGAQPDDKPEGFDERKVKLENER